MPDKHIEVTERSWGSNILGAIKGVGLGLILILASFFVLWRNEGRLDMSKVAAKSIPVQANAVDSSADGKLVAVTGVLASSEELGDAPYLKPAPYIKLSRDVEMFAWVEETKSTTEKKTGGKSVTTTEYTYKREWTSRPEDAGDFKIPEGHANPSLSIEDESFTVTSARVGVYSIDPARIGLPSSEELQLTTASVMAGQGRLDDNYLYIGEGSMQSPRVGDVRISYRAVPSDIEVTAFGKLEGDRLVPYLHKGEHRLYAAHASDRDSAIVAMSSAHTTTGWLLRGLGFLMMWIGSNLVLGPIGAVLDVLPFLGNLSRKATGLVTFILSLIVSGIIIVVSAIAHSPLMLFILGCIVAIIGVVAFLGFRKVRA
ncbi:MAG: TMEM43 family protein, partial [Chloroflexota bacterium]|nr:TMEM43 family protein [Chloroflexota bacterium]